METNTQLYLDFARLFLGTIILFYASYTDIKTRRASNMLWVILGISGLILLVIQYFTIGFENQYYILFIPIMIGLIYLLFQMGLIFGGADAKALMAIAILVPIQPAIAQFPLWKTLMPFSFVIFFNSLLLFLAIPLGLFIFNIFKKDIKFPHSFLGYKTDIQKARKKFVWPLEKIVDGKLKFIPMPKNFDVNDEYDELEKHGIKNIWVTPKVPFMIPLLVGYIVSFIIGDILFHLMRVSI